MPNADELNATLDVIKANPQLWDQNTFYDSTECGTTACFYGWTLLRHGYTIRGMGPDEIHQVVRNILEVDDSEGDALAYYFTDSIEDLELRVKAIIAGEWAEPRDEDETRWRGDHCCSGI
jgi:hypothetical protein